MSAAAASRPTLHVLVASKIPNLHAAIAAELAALPHPPRRHVELHAFPYPPSAMASAEVIVADPSRFDADALPSLRWYQSTWAGVDALFKPLSSSSSSSSSSAAPSDDGGTSTHASTMESRGIICTRLGGVFGDLMAEYVIGSVLGHELRLREAAELQRHGIWDQEPFAKRRRLATLTMGVLGASGSIGGVVCATARAMGMSVVGLASSRPDAPPPTAYTPLDSLDDVLACSDYLVSILPSTAATRGLLGGDALRGCAARAPVLINVGRGDLLDEASLLNALTRGWISGAVLDVFEGEPLVESSALWSR